MTGPLTAEEFYAQRDDRTNRLTESRDYHRLRICLVAGPQVVNRLSGQVQVLLAANQLARWCRHIELVFPDAPLASALKIAPFSTLHERVIAEMREADPFGAFTFVEQPSRDIDYVLLVGRDANGVRADFNIDAEGWSVFAGRDQITTSTTSNSNNPLAPAFAACLGVADAFKVGTHQREAWRIRAAVFDLYNVSLSRDGLGGRLPLPASIDLGNALLVGLGSVGSATAYLLRMLPITGNLTLIDHDIVGIENLNRSPVFGISDVGRLKTDVVTNYLARHVPTASFGGQYASFINEHQRRPGDIDLIFAMANEFGVRAQIESNMPPIQIYGTTAPSGVINFHRHVPLIEDCSVCRFPSLPEGVQPQFVCSDAQVEIAPGKQIDAALPFMSVGAAILAVADLVRLQLPDHPAAHNYAEVDLLGPLEHIGHRQRQARPDCSCRTRSSIIHRRYVASTRFFSAQEV